jgi:hypothetical protein
MSAITRATSRIRRLPVSCGSTLSRTPILRRQTILPSSSGLLNARSIVTPSRPFEQKRWASAAAQAVETAEGEVQEEVWPERILPTVSDKDAQRLKRQRNVGM